MGFTAGGFYGLREGQLPRELWMCKSCREPRELGRTLCARHAAMNKERAKALASARKAKGLCVQCGAKREEGRTRCRRCLDKGSANSRRHYGLAAGIDAPPRVSDADGEFAWQLTCVLCAQPFTSKKRNTRYCGVECQRVSMPTKQPKNGNQAEGQSLRRDVIGEEIWMTGAL